MTKFKDLFENKIKIGDEITLIKLPQGKLSKKYKLKVGNKYLVDEIKWTSKIVKIVDDSNNTLELSIDHFQ